MVLEQSVNLLKHMLNSVILDSCVCRTVHIGQPHAFPRLFARITSSTGPQALVPNGDSSVTSWILQRCAFRLHSMLQRLAALVSSWFCARTRKCFRLMRHFRCISLND